VTRIEDVRTQPPRRPDRASGPRRRPRTGAATVAIGVAIAGLGLAAVAVGGRVGVLVALLLVLAICAALSHRAWIPTLAMVGLAIVVGEYVESRLGGSTHYRAALLLVAGAGFIIAVRLCERSTTMVRAALEKRAPELLTLCCILRLVPGLYGMQSLQSGHVWSLQIGEFTRPLAIATLASAGYRLTSNLRARPLRSWLITGLAGAYLLELVLVGDLGPAALSAIGFTVALPALRNPSRRAILFLTTGSGLALSLALIAGVGALRLHVMIQPSADSQIARALSATAYGGLIGDGNLPQLNGVFAAGSDLLPDMAIGLLGAIPLVLLVVGLAIALGHLVATADRVRDDASRSVAAALAVSLTATAVWSIAANIDLLPLTGISTPFLVPTGSAIVPSMVTLGTVIGIINGSPKGRLNTQTGQAIASLVTLRVPAILALGVLVSASLSPAVSSDASAYFPRGALLTQDGQPIAVPGPDSSVRLPNGTRYLEVGYAGNGNFYGVESMAASTLTCGDKTPGMSLSTMLHPRRCIPATVVTTVNSRVQAAAATALGGLDGEAAVLDSATGEVLALYGSNDVTPPDAKTVLAIPARNDAVPVGSVFKIVTASAGIMAGIDPAPAPLSTLQFEQGELTNEDGQTCPAPTITMMLAMSCNSVAGWLAEQMGAANLSNTAQRYFGFDTPPTYARQSDLYDGGRFIAPETGLSPNTPSDAVARTGAGLQGVRATVLDLAEIGAVVAQAGRLAPGPHIIAGACHRGRFQPIEPKQSTIGQAPLPADVGAAVQAGMRKAVTDGTARSLADVAPDVLAKTGTADVGQLPNGHTNESLIAVLDHRYVVAVIVHLPTLGASPVAVRAGAKIIKSLSSIGKVKTC
jgi:cell division protein FtsW (lipid II flippase)